MILIVLAYKSEESAYRAQLTKVGYCIWVAMISISKISKVKNILINFEKWKSQKSLYGKENR